MTLLPQPDQKPFPTPEQAFTFPAQPDSQPVEQPPVDLECFRQALQAGDDAGLLCTYTSVVNDLLTPAEQTILVQARQRLRVAIILRDAVQRDDDDTLCRWHFPALWQEAGRELPIPAERLHLALVRQQALTKIQAAFECGNLPDALRLWRMNDLEKSNLPNALDRARIKNAVDGLLPPVSKPSSDPVQAWLEGQPGSPELEDAAVWSGAQQLGYQARVEHASHSGDLAALAWLASPHLAAFWKSLPHTLRSEIDHQLSASLPINPILP